MVYNTNKTFWISKNKNCLIKTFGSQLFSGEGQNFEH